MTSLPPEVRAERATKGAPEVNADTDPSLPEVRAQRATKGAETDLLDEFAGFDDLPTVANRTTSHAPSAPRFDGDVSEMPDRACWALQNLLARRYVSGDRQPQLWSWVSEYQDVLRIRLSELDLRLRLVDELQVAFVEQAGYDSRWGRRILKRETVHTYDAILALHLAKYIRAARDEDALITREEIHELFAGVTNTIDRDLALFDKRIERAIDKMEELEFLRKQRDDADTFTVSPVISAVMTASVITDLQRQFEQFIGSGDTGEEPPEAAAADATDLDAEDAYSDDEGDNW
ncbi:DUF4194 domain-containing protein [Gordonia rubripertincta]|uniref:DUF4194 domain-containing protein n=2 Tax=Gordonia rubripertincta TaxID=36822 RepID=A0AAW6R6M7_GORRU|nr:DUF4194 domain-containing protein [Gordonia rubripertincta]MDG6781554.1 DUF4194 domain-containing protein [Gordonia rubripertincta]NKY61426.1 DUF4194 domain-containing protein [Gordonia rubripertincta]NKY61673.1 DUF4194 domain-containing protein [Gordonia rubripertincta]GAB83981.1 hypothetical protein GORBP_025_00240 [Gordonia rubripertincta NBRC 101908]